MESFTTVIPQNAKAIIFEEINANQCSLRQLLDTMEDGETFESGAMLKEIAKNLEVASFGEFLGRFQPVVYQSAVMMPDGRPQFQYSAEEQPGSVPIDICKQSFYEMVQNLIRVKSNSGKSNIEAPYDMIQELLSPKSEMKHAMQVRQDTEYCYKKSLELESKNRMEEAKKYKRKCRNNFQEIQARYEKSAVSILPLAIDDIHRIIEERASLEQQALLGKQDDPEVLDADGNSAVPKLCSFGWDDNGELKALEKEDLVQQADGEPEDTETKFLALWENVADKTPTIAQSSYMKNTFLSCYTGNTKYLRENEPIEKLVQRHEEYVNLYKSTQDNFLDAVGKLIQKVLNVEMFFKHATGTDGKLPAGAKVIISNCTVSDLLSKDKTKEKFTQYIESINDTPKEKIWFAVLPPVLEDRFMDEEDDDPDLFDFSDAQEEKKVSKDSVGARMEEVKEMIGILDKVHIFSFFNFKASDKTGFGSFSEKVLKDYQTVLSERKLQSDYALLAYPNFTVIPKEESRVTIAGEIRTDKQEYTGSLELTIPRIYVDAAYVAAGMVVASQNIALMKEKYGYAVVKDTPNVRFDFEGEYRGEENRFKITTVFNRENLLNRSFKLTSEIQSEGFGFCFGQNERGENKSGNTYVEICRTLKGSPLYKMLVTEYLFKYVLSQVGSNLTTKPKLVKTVGEISSFGRHQAAKNAGVVNRLFYSEEEDVVIKENSPMVKFGTDERLIPISFTIEE